MRRKHFVTTSLACCVFAAILNAVVSQYRITVAQQQQLVQQAEQAEQAAAVFRARSAGSAAGFAWRPSPPAAASVVEYGGDGNSDNKNNNSNNSNNNKNNNSTLSSPLPLPLPIRVVERYLRWHSSDALLQEEYDNNEKSSGIIGSISRRKYALAYYHCPFSAGNRLHEFMNGAFLACLAFCFLFLGRSFVRSVHVKSVGPS